MLITVVMALMKSPLQNFPHREVVPRALLTCDEDLERLHVVAIHATRHRQMLVPNFVFQKELSTSLQQRLVHTGIFGVKVK